MPEGLKFNHFPEKDRKSPEYEHSPEYERQSPEGAPQVTFRGRERFNWRAALQLGVPCFALTMATFTYLAGFSEYLQGTSDIIWKLPPLSTIGAVFYVSSMGSIAIGGFAGLEKRRYKK